MREVYYAHGAMIRGESPPVIPAASMYTTVEGHNYEGQGVLT